MNTRRRRWGQWLGLGAALLALGAVFTAYLDPHLMADLANRVWACF